VGSKGAFNPQNGGAQSYQQQMQRNKPPQTQPGAGAPHGSSQQSVKAAAASGSTQASGMQSAQALNFRQNLNISLQQIHNHAKGSGTGAYRNPSHPKNK